MTTAQKPDALPVVAHLLEESRRWKARALTTTDRAMAEREAQARNDGSTVSALVRLSDAQAALLAKEAECETLRVQLAAGPLYSTRLKAKRYDWLREQSHPWGSRWLSLQELDAAIDAARAAADQGGAS